MSQIMAIGSNDAATLDVGSIWPTSWALREMTEEHERRIEELVRRAVGWGSGGLG